MVYITDSKGLVEGATVSSFWASPTYVVTVCLFASRTGKLRIVINDVLLDDVAKFWLGVTKPERVSLQAGDLVIQLVPSEDARGLKFLVSEVL